MKKYRQKNNFLIVITINYNSGINIFILFIDFYTYFLTIRFI